MANDMNYTWIPFYMELADKLLENKNNRQYLIEILNELDDKYIGYFRNYGGIPIKYIDPFSFIAVLNRGANDASRKVVATHYKDKLGIEADVPKDFDGIPLVNAMFSYFVFKEDGRNERELWQLFEDAMTDSDSLGLSFDAARGLRGISWNITMFLFWIRPKKYLPLDKHTREYLKAKGMKIKKVPTMAEYRELLATVNDKINSGIIECRDFVELSYTAWGKDNDADKTLNPEVSNMPAVWIWHDNNSDNIQNHLNDGILPFDITNGHDDMLGSEFRNLQEYSKAHNENYDGTNVQAAYWQLCHDIREDDILILVHGRRKVKGWGRISALAQIDIGKPIHKWITAEWQEKREYELPFDVRSLFFKKASADNARILIDLLGILPTQHATMPTEPPMTNKYQTYIDLLKETHNLVLTGAPGTGKTFMAKAIAKEMRAVTEFVQFHPSYDYTDFVEGLRPVEKGEDQVGFRRMDGIFKRFCKRAILDVADADDVLSKLNGDPTVWKVSLGGTYENPARTDCLKNGYVRIGWSEYGDVEDFCEKDDYPTGGKVILRAFQSEMKVGDIVVSCYSQNETDAIGIVTGDYEYRAEGGNLPRYRTVEWLIKDVQINIKDVLGKKMTLSTVYKLNISVPKILDLVRSSGGLKTPVVHKDKSYVMIIDEINRGELSKIFGELFYAIDPGYRGECGRVKTQFQNLIDDSDVFAEGFYIPENVYILATMNDIDRSVESMDFAMRRRFTWQEVTPQDTELMLDPLLCAKEAKATMHRLNDAIAKTDGLGAAYMIGPSYFLKLGANGGDFEKLWRMNIEPLLREYLRGFRKASEIMDKFHKAYFNTKASEVSDLLEE